MNKLTMAHEYVMNYMASPDCKDTTVSNIVSVAWSYADSMQDEADNRVKDQDKADAEKTKRVRDTLQNSGKDWQPNWSVSPDWANYWSIDFGGHCGRWYSEEPKKDVLYYQGRVNSLGQDSPTFGYIGLWQESLRKRPE